MLNTPVAFIVFNRPRYTKQTFESIRNARPKELFLIADGPRTDHANDHQLCNEVKSILEKIDWPCNVHRNYSETNLGLKKRVSSGLDWVFSQVDRAIILEDDCLAHPDFYTFCDDLLNRYENNNKVWVITGDNHQQGHRRGDASYFFSKYSDCWGWATWKRAWQHYESDISFWPEWKKTKDWKLKTVDSIESRYWNDIFDRVYSNKISSSWFYPWFASVWYHSGLTAVSNVNLVSNIGIGPDATHTIADKEQEGLPVASLGVLTHPNLIEANLAADRCSFDHRFGGLQLRFPYNLRPLPRRIASGIYKKLRSFLKGIFIKRV